MRNIFILQISETFHFDLNSEQTKRMIAGHVSRQDISTLSRACVFSITYPSPDVFLVVRVSRSQERNIDNTAVTVFSYGGNMEVLRDMDWTLGFRGMLCSHQE